jgi:quercetin dioxygenase-like cupin family protein
MKIITNQTQGYLWGENCMAWPLFSNPNLNVKEELIPPNSQEEMHFHQHSQQYIYILKGKAFCILNDQEFNLSAGDSIHIPAGDLHQVKNIHHSFLRFLLISLPPVEDDINYP